MDCPGLENNAISIAWCNDDSAPVIKGRVQGKQHGFLTFVRILSACRARDDLVRQLALKPRFLLLSAEDSLFNLRTYWTSHSITCILRVY